MIIAGTGVFQNCYYCGTAPKNKVGDRVKQVRQLPKYNGIDRRDNALGYTETNCVPACKDCNYAKRDLSEERFIKLCQNIARRHEW